MSDVRTHQAMIRKAMEQSKKKAKGAAISLYGHKKAVKMFQKKAKTLKND
jgi:hypothetical protein